MTFSILITLGVSVIVSNRYINNYFNDYIHQTYNENIRNILEYGRLFIQEGHHPRSILNSYVKDPIYYVEVYDLNENLLVTSGTQNSRFKFLEASMTVESHDIIVDDAIIGTVILIRETSTDNTVTSQLFGNALLSGAIVSTIIALTISGAILFVIIRVLGQNVDRITNYAIGHDMQRENYRITEFTSIAKAIHNNRIRLAEKEQIKKQKFDQLLHDTKTPITILKSQLEGITDGIIPADVKRCKGMLEQVDQLDEMLQDITTIIDGIAKEPELKLQKLDYGRQLEKIIKSLKPKFKIKNLSLDYSYEPFIITTHPRILDKVIYNILINSYKYTSDGGVMVTTDQHKQSITIRDTGMGIPKDELAHIFDPYFRGSNITAVSGEGLGLSNAKAVVERLNGQLEVHSQLNEYTEFTIKL